MYEERNRTLVQWIPWIQKNAGYNYTRYKNSQCECSDVFQAGCVRAIESIDEGKHTPFKFADVNSRMQREVRRHVTMLDSGNACYDDETSYASRKIGLCKKIDVRDAVAKLDKKERAVVIMYYYQDMGLEEIGEAISLSGWSVKNIRDKAIRRLHEILH